MRGERSEGRGIVNTVWAPRYGSDDERTWSNECKWATVRPSTEPGNRKDNRARSKTLQPVCSDSTVNVIRIVVRQSTLIISRTGVRREIGFAASGDGGSSGLRRRYGLNKGGTIASRNWNFGETGWLRFDPAMAGRWRTDSHHGMRLRRSRELEDLSRFDFVIR